MLCPGASLAANGALEQVMGLLAQRRGGEVQFAETDYLKILDRPVRSSGVLVYEAPGHLEKRTLKPKAQSLILDGGTLTVERGGRTYRMQASAYPQVAALVDAIRDTLAGKEGALERVFKVGFTGTLENWQLRLVPLDKEVARKVTRVQILGARDEIRSVTILEAGGDRSVMMLGAP
jgi:hypothetical protein